MKKLHLIIIFALFAMIVCTSCGKDNSKEDIKESPYIAGLTTDNYPNVDGSTSTDPLNIIIACKLFDINYKWAEKNDLKAVVPENNGYIKLWSKIKSSQTNNSIINIIDKKAELTLSARKMSPDEKTYADNKGVSLIETPIALDALVIIVNNDNLISSLTTKQVQDIYTSQITNWNEVGNKNKQIIPYVRNPNSGSQELFESLVMKDLNISDFQVNDFEVIQSMSGAIDKVALDIYSICYTVYYYLEYQSLSKYLIKSISVNGINPNKASISDRSYPYTAEVYTVIRSDLDESSMAYKLYEWLQTEAGKQVINESGYIPY